MSSPPGAVGSPDLTAPGNLEILAHTAASQASDIHGGGEHAHFPGEISYYGKSSKISNAFLNLFSNIKNIHYLD